MHTPMLGIKLIILQKTLMNWAEASPLPLLALLLMYMWHYKSFHVFEGKFYVVITVLFLIVHLRQYSTLWPLPALLTQSSYLSILSARIAAVHHHAWLGTVWPIFLYFSSSVCDGLLGTPYFWVAFFYGYDVSSFCQGCFLLHRHFHFYVFMFTSLFSTMVWSLSSMRVLWE